MVAINSVAAAGPVSTPRPAESGDRPDVVLRRTPSQSSPKAFADTPAYQAAASPPADLEVRSAAFGRLVYVFRDPENGRPIRQYPTEAMQTLADRAGTLLDREV
jgi:hypothetical protein